MRFLIILLLLISVRSSAQMALAIDSIKNGLAHAKTTRDRASMLDILSRTYMNVNLQ